MSGPFKGKTSAFLAASRPKTLVAVVIPVLLASAAAWQIGAFHSFPAVVCLLFGLLIQIGTNFANDLYDFEKGTDTEARVGPPRAVASGWVNPQEMRRATHGVFALSLIMGSFLIPHGGLWLLPLGIICILLGYAYTAGPFPLAYNGLGEVFVLLFFGWVATAFTFYVQAGHFGWNPDRESGLPALLLLGWIPGALATNLLVLNNYRDVDEDRETNKRTLIVSYGRNFGRWEYGFFWLSSATAIVGLWLLQGLLWGLPAAGVNLAGGWILQKKLGQARHREQFDSLLKGTAGLLLLVGFLLAIGIVLES